LFARWMRSRRLAANNTPNSILNLDKTTAIREAELLRLEASLAATPREEHARAYRQHPQVRNMPGVDTASANSNA
ncbi:MAG: hypothetical protein QGG29_04070, partial [Prochlorococcaceae cyanobacterium ETNP18_MAG_17]|nr:hypothetical protein [Prochlorococcaceae cyanobacterium ETNP18_MAG_17]